MYRTSLIAGALLAMIAVMLGAFAAHGLTNILTPDKIDVFQKGVTYQFYHCFALLLTGILYASFPFKALRTASTLFIIGIIFFSGTLYLYPLLEVKDIAIPVAARLVTPLGGLSFMLGWLLLLSGIIKKK